MKRRMNEVAERIAKKRRKVSIFLSFFSIRSSLTRIWVAGANLVDLFGLTALLGDLPFFMIV